MIVSTWNCRVVLRRLGFSDWIRVEATGFAWGIWVLWNSWETNVDYLCSSTQFLHCRVTNLSSGVGMLVTFIYGDTTLSARQPLWHDLKHLSDGINESWLNLGDFNTFLDPTDKLGGQHPLVSL